MPTSQYQQIPKILNLILAYQPKSVLDIGVGFGKYGFLCREYLEVWGHTDGYGTFERTIDGIEVFEKYLTPVHTFIYNNIFVGDALDVVMKLETKYDLVLLMDVFEHFHKEDGLRLMKKLLNDHRAVIVSVPKDIGHQEDVFENEHETHHAEWTYGEMKSFGETICVDDAESLICFISKDKRLASQVKEELMQMKMKTMLMRFPMLRRTLKKLKTLFVK